jgi:hypothetical protein
MVIKSPAAVGSRTSYLPLLQTLYCEELKLDVNILFSLRHVRLARRLKHAGKQLYRTIAAI